MHNNLVQPDQAILVGVGVNQIFSVEDLDELSLLCQTCNIETVGRIIQNRKDVDVTYYIGKGKVEEIKNLIAETKANVVVFDVELSGSKVRNLERELNVPVLDRSKVILDIFAARKPLTTLIFFSSCAKSRARPFFSSSSISLRRSWCPHARVT